MLKKIVSICEGEMLRSALKKSGFKYSGGGEYGDGGGGRYRWDGTKFVKKGKFDQPAVTMLRDYPKPGANWMARFAG